jgi:hypothetical protein
MMSSPSNVKPADVSQDSPHPRVVSQPRFTALATEIYQYHVDAVGGGPSVREFLQEPSGQLT